MISLKYKARVDLLLRVLPFIAQEEIFALKGGSAINLFIRDMPRLSVDIDLTYLPIDTRVAALNNIQDGLRRIQVTLEKHIKDIKVQPVPKGDGFEVKLNCQYLDAQIKIEVNTVTRGHVLPVNLMKVRNTVQDAFGKFAALNVISVGELYGGKICAAIDRQHPRDLFDVMLLLENEGVTEEIWDGFLISLLSHYKPTHELLSPFLKDQHSAFRNQFAGMTDIPFLYEDYTSTRNKLIEIIRTRLTESDKQLLLSFESGNPDWAILQYEVVKELPAIKWKLQNILKLKQENRSKHDQMMELLGKVLSH